jgi:hypothetical protein
MSSTLILPAIHIERGIREIVIKSDRSRVERYIMG